MSLGYDDAPYGHAEMLFDDVKVPLNHLLGSEGQGFEIAQSRLGPGRLHHCMRTIGIGRRALDLTVQRVTRRATFGSLLSSKSSVQMIIGRCAVQLRAARLLVLCAADALDVHGSKFARAHIACAKIFVPKSVCELIDAAIQLHGAAGMSEDYPLARMYAAARALRIADGPDEVHLMSVGKMECLRSRL